MKRLFYLPELPNRKVQALLDGVLSYFRHSILRVEFDHATSQLEIEWASVGRSLHCDSDMASTIVITMDNMRAENISCYVNGFYEAVKK